MCVWCRRSERTSHPGVVPVCFVQFWWETLLLPNKEQTLTASLSSAVLFCCFCCCRLPSSFYSSFFLLILPSLSFHSFPPSQLFLAPFPSLFFFLLIPSSSSSASFLFSSYLSFFLLPSFSPLVLSLFLFLIPSSVWFFVLFICTIDVTKVDPVKGCGSTAHWRKKGQEGLPTHPLLHFNS